MAMKSEEKEISITNWELRHILGRGSYGIVYFGVPIKPDLGCVAIKVAPSHSAATLVRETVILEEFIGSPEIVQYIGHDFTFDEKDCFYSLILEYAPGGTLLDLIKKRGKLKETDIKPYLRMILKGLSQIHKNGLVHSDLKPENILVFVSDDGEIKLKLADFGLSTWCDEKTEEGSAVKQRRLTFKGTARYMSPESLFGEVNSALDIWSLGCVFMNMITGEQMWNNCSNNKQVLPKLVNGSKIPNVPTALSDLGRDFLMKCFERNHKRRWSADMLLKHPYLDQELVVKKSFENSLPIVAGVCSIFVLGYYLNYFL